MHTFRRVTQDGGIAGGRGLRAFVGGGVLPIFLFVAACSDLTSPEVPVEELVRVSVLQDRDLYFTSLDMIYLVVHNDSEQPIRVRKGTHCDGVSLWEEVDDEWVLVKGPMCTLAGILSVNGGEMGVIQRATNEREDRPGIYRIGVRLATDGSFPTVEFELYTDHEVEFRSR